MPVTASFAGPVQTDATNRFRMLQSMARVRNSASISIPNSAETLLTWDTEDFNTDGMHSLAQNTSRLTAKVKGNHLVWCAIEFDASAAGGRYVRLYINGVAQQLLVSMPVCSSALSAVLAAGQDIALNANDYVELYVYQASGGPLNVAPSALRTVFGMRYVGE